MGEDNESSNSQMDAIQKVKTGLAWNLFFLIILSFAVSAGFYFLTLWENPKLLPSRADLDAATVAMNSTEADAAATQPQDATATAAAEGK